MAKNTIKQLKDLSRSELVNFYHVNGGTEISDLFKTNIWGWVKDYIKNRFGGKEAFRAYPKDGDEGVYPLFKGMDGRTVLAVASDWATNTSDAALIGQFMRQEDADYTLHLGDIYFVGTPQEVEVNFGKKGDKNDHGSWAYGSKGFLALPGNHEFYSKGIGFYDNLLSKTYVATSENTSVNQKAGFFCLENKYWRIIGLDTGYTSVGIPIIEFIFPAKCELRKEQVDWLRDVVKLGDPNDKRGIIIMSHHQYFTAFEGGQSFERPAEQIAEIMGEKKSKMPVIWYWGHQHILSLYELNKVGKGIPAYGRCIGHGGMPIDVVSIIKSADVKCAIDNKLLYYDPRFVQFDEKTRIGFNGYLKLTLDKETMIAEHIQIKEKDLSINRTEIRSEDMIDWSMETVMTEKWTIDISNGVLSFELTDEIDTPLSKFTAPNN
jgi:hypothetical protein